MSIRSVLLSLLLVFVGVAAGIFLGTELFGTADRQTGTDQDPVSRTTFATRYLALNSGDPFPFDDVRDSLGQTLLPPEVVFGKSTILLFVEPGCGACFDLLRLWHSEAAGAISPDVNVFACVPQGEVGLSPEFDQQLENLRVLSFDGALLGDMINLSFWPTTIGIDTEGRISFAIEGFSDDIVQRLSVWESNLRKESERR